MLPAVASAAEGALAAHAGIVSVSRRAKRIATVLFIRSQLLSKLICPLQHVGTLLRFVSVVQAAAAEDSCKAAL
jgi:hypothetical protein